MATTETIDILIFTYLIISFISTVNMPGEPEKKATYGSRYFNLMLLISQSVAVSSATIIPRNALKYGPLGCLIFYILTSILIGIPLYYMELIIGQFTGLNSFEVWKVRPCLSHIGHLIVLWQAVNLYLNHVIATYVIHYLFISFEHPKPYYTCDPWMVGHCDVLATNFTVNQDCIKSGPRFPYCEKLYTTFPETHYFKKIIVHHARKFYVEWRLSLPSGIACFLLYVSCFKRRRSMEWFISVVTFYPSLGFALLMLGSMAQKGILLHYQDAMDIAFENFGSNFKLFHHISVSVYTLSLGTGLVINVGASSPFRAPCYSNAVYTMAANIAFHVVLVVTSAMLVCPYSFKHAMSPERTAAIPLAHIFERLPTMLREYDNNSVWVIIAFSSYACIAMRTSSIMLYNLLEVFSKRFLVVAKYPGLVTLCVSFFLFFSTLPIYGYMLKFYLSKSFRICLQLFNMFVVIIECLAFILFYGLDRFCEDVHFMQGIRPSNYVKLSWIISSFLLSYVCIKEMYYIATTKHTFEKMVGVWVFGIAVAYLVVVGVVKVVLAAWRQQARAALRLSTAWRPRSELLQRSRAMFTAQAMTKEYLYRQYHLQAAILARQQRADRSRVAIEDS